MLCKYWKCFEVRGKGPDGKPVLDMVPCCVRSDDNPNSIKQARQAMDEGGAIPDPLECNAKQSSDKCHFKGE